MWKLKSVLNQSVTRHSEVSDRFSNFFSIGNNEIGEMNCLCTSIRDVDVLFLLQLFLLEVW